MNSPNLEHSSSLSLCRMKSCAASASGGSPSLPAPSWLSFSFHKTSKGHCFSWLLFWGAHLVPDTVPGTISFSPHYNLFRMETQTHSMSRETQGSEKSSHSPRVTLLMSFFQILPDMFLEFPSMFPPQGLCTGPAAWNTSLQDACVAPSSLHSVSAQMSLLQRGPP